MKFLCLLMLSITAFAHPVSYKGSKGVMGQHSPILIHNQLNYSLEHWFAVGVHYIKRPNLDDKDAKFLSSNFLLKRWNGEKLQANLYASFGLGESALGYTSETSGLGALQFDIEDRDYYFLAKHQRVQNSERTDFEQNFLRAGISPYVVNFDGIHSWLILEWQESKFADGAGLTDLTPFLRIFHKNLLFEIGQSFDGITKFNYITHF